MKFHHLQKTWLWHLIGPAVVIAAIYWAGPAKVWQILSGVDIRFFAMAACAAIPIAVIKGIRWKILLNGYNIDITLGESISMYTIGSVLSVVTPGHVGDMVKILPLIKRGCGIAKAIASNIIDRLFDVVFILLAGYIAMLYFSQYFTYQLKIINIIAAGVIVVSIIIALKRHLLKNLALKLVPSQFHSTAKDSWGEITGVLKKKHIGRLLVIAILTILYYLLHFTAIYLCGMALSIKASFIFLSACAAVSTILSLLPITVAGVGTRDAVFILLLSQLGIEKQQSLALSSLILVLFLTNCGLFYIISVIFGHRKLR